MNVFVIKGSNQYYDLFLSMGHAITNRLADAELMVFTGGADVSPELYGDYMHALTGNSPERDKEEVKYFNHAVKNNIPMVGICRGAQFLNVMSGGRMYQHVEKHTRSHVITDVLSGETVYVSSTHHQMMMPAPDALLVATAALGGEREWFDVGVARKDISKEDIEVVYYANTNCLCFQPHPEFDRPEYQGMRAYFKGLLARYLGVK